jgi:transketolase
MTDLRVYDDEERLAVAAADVFFRKMKTSIRSQGIFSVALSGGSTPRPMFRRIARAAVSAAEWERTHFFWVDERYVPPDSAESNYHVARKLLLRTIPVPPRNIHRIRTEVGSPEEVAREYDRELRSFFVEIGKPRFDLAFLGLGKDGHTASLFPRAQPNAAELARRDLNAPWAAAVRMPDPAGSHRLTLTPRAINSAADIVFMVSGEDKAAILREVLDLGPSQCPARLIAGAHRVLWLADRKAASRIETAQAADPVAQLEGIADQLRIHSIRATTAAGSGHPTSCCSAADLVAALFFSKMRYDPQDPRFPNNDRFVLSKGHAAPLLYAAWVEAGYLNPDMLDTLRSFGSPLEGHPTPRLEFVDVATGSLGQGLAAGAGMAASARINHLPYATYVLMGDGELAEGSVWEAAGVAAHRGLGNLCAIVDANRLGQSRPTAFGHDLEPYRARFEAFGWKTRIIDGHSMRQILEALEPAGQGDRPLAIIARTIKGKGIAMTEDQEGWHGKALSREQAHRAISALGHTALSAEGWRPRMPEPLEPAMLTHPPARHPAPGEPAYPAGKEVATRRAAAAALVRAGAGDSRIVVLDGDVGNSTHTIEFEQAYPDRFIECYIAEQTMVGMATGLAARGHTPFAVTFASFLTRAFDQLRVAGISRSNLKLIGTHAGTSIGEDGPSQMGLEDLAMMRTLPGSRVFQPCDAVSAGRLVELMVEHDGIDYLRALRPPTPIIYPAGERFEPGGAKILRQTGQDVVTVVATGITVHEALAARDHLASQGLPFTLIDAYSIKPLASRLIFEASRATRQPLSIITVEDHYAEGGLGDALAGELSDLGVRVVKLAVREIPVSGPMKSLLAHYGIDATAIEGAVLDQLPQQLRKTA